MSLVIEALTAIGIIGGVLAYVEKRYRDMHSAIIEIQVNQKWIRAKIDTDDPEAVRLTRVADEADD